MESKKRDPFARMRARDAARKAAKEREEKDGLNDSKMIQIHAEESVKEAIQKCDSILNESSFDIATAKQNLSELRSVLREYGNSVSLQLNRRGRIVADTLAERIQENSFHFSANIRKFSADNVELQNSEQISARLYENECVDGYLCAGFEHRKEENLIFHLSNLYNE